MPADRIFIRDSMELNLFFLRILKEHALFLQLGFMPKNKSLADQAQSFRRQLDELLRQAIRMSKGYVSNEAIQSGELFTRYTEEAERQTQFFTGVPIDIELTLAEYNVAGDTLPPATLRPAAQQLNAEALDLANELLAFKRGVLEDVLSCRIITNNYPEQIHHVIDESQHYIQLLKALMAGESQQDAHGFADEQAFWNHIMHEHAQFIDGLLDPSEEELKEQARTFENIFETLELQARAAERRLQMLPQVTAASLNAARGFRDFKAQGTQGILSCDIRSIILPLLSDHVLREANYYLRILKENGR